MGGGLLEKGTKTVHEHILFFNQATHYDFIIPHLFFRPL